MSLPPTVTEEGVLCGKKKTKTTADPTLSFCYDPGVGGEGPSRACTLTTRVKSLYIQLVQGQQYRARLTFT